MTKRVQLKLTGAIVLAGEVRRAREVVEVDGSTARNLLARGKAVLDAIQPDEGETVPALSELTVPELRELAVEYQIADASKMKKDQLISAIERIEGAA